MFDFNVFLLFLLVLGFAWCICFKASWYIFLVPFPFYILLYNVSIFEFIYLAIISVYISGFLYFLMKLNKVVYIFFIIFLFYLNFFYGFSRSNLLNLISSKSLYIYYIPLTPRSLDAYEFICLLPYSILGTLLIFCFTSFLFIFIDNVYIYFNNLNPFIYCFFYKKNNSVYICGVGTVLKVSSDFTKEDLDQLKMDGLVKEFMLSHQVDLQRAVEHELIGCHLKTSGQLEKVLLNSDLYEISNGIKILKEDVTLEIMINKINKNEMLSSDSKQHLILGLESISKYIHDLPEQYRVLQVFIGNVMVGNKPHGAVITVVESSVGKTKIFFTPYTHSCYPYDLTTYVALNTKVSFKDYMGQASIQYSGGNIIYKRLFLKLNNEDKVIDFVNLDKGIYRKTISCLDLESTCAYIPVKHENLTYKFDVYSKLVNGYIHKDDIINLSKITIKQNKVPINEKFCSTHDFKLHNALYPKLEKINGALPESLNNIIKIFL